MSPARVRSLPINKVRIDKGLMGERRRTNRKVTLPIIYARYQETGRIDALKQDWQPGEPGKPHHFWDSDVAKWIEAAGYILATETDPELERQVDHVVELLAAAQQDDGYLNTYYSVVEPENRWSNLRDMHELYCAGHLMEAAVAHYEATGKEQLLDVMCSYADYIATVFGREEGQLRGYPGHEEIELALVKLYRATGQQRFLDLASYFVDERGRQPHYYDIEASARGEDPASSRFGGKYDYNQSHVPVREQSTAEGHAVRAVYLYAAMADLAGETDDRALLDACKRLWRNVTRRRMYVTGGIGSSATGERFTVDYDLPNQLAYAETCAAIGLVFWANRMLQAEPDSEYADVTELALYNGVLSGLSQGGDTFFYANPLQVVPERYIYRPDIFRPTSVFPVRQPFFQTSCCPGNVSRLLASLGQYAYLHNEDELFVNLYLANEAEIELPAGKLVLRQTTAYPWSGGVTLEVAEAPATDYSISLRLPRWCASPSLALNDDSVPLEGSAPGYATVSRQWAPGDVLTLDLPMDVQFLHAHPRVSESHGRVAIQRGPLIYCLEQIDNGPNLEDIALGSGALVPREDPQLLGGCVVLEGTGSRSNLSEWDESLYRASPTAREAVPVMAVPYYLWGNRKPGEMLVWIQESAASLG